MSDVTHCYHLNESCVFVYVYITTLLTKDQLWWITYLCFSEVERKSMPAWRQTINLNSYNTLWKKVINNVSSSHLLHDADGLGAVLRRRVQQDPVVEWLQHRFHRLHAAHQAHKLCGDVTYSPHYRCNPGGGAGGTARPSALIRYSSTRGVHLLADPWQRQTRRDMKLTH